MIRKRPKVKVSVFVIAPVARALAEQAARCGWSRSALVTQLILDPGAVTRREREVRREQA
jgi:hypothetical protein